jgi:MEMO1 family protein
MPIVFSAFVPHSPLLIKEIGKVNSDKLAVTDNALAKLSTELEQSRAQTVLVISPHGPVRSGFFTMNLRPEFRTDLEEFGDFSNQQKWPGNIGLAYRIREKLETSAPLQLLSEEKLDYGASVPLIKLTAGLQLSIIPLYYSGLSFEAHFKFGTLLNRELMVSKENIAVIASGDLSHRVTKDAPAGYSPKGKKFDQKVIDLILKNKNQDLLGLDPEFAREAGECGLRSLLILAGILDRVKCQVQLLSYEAPFGVGYAVVQFKF